MFLVLALILVTKWFFSFMRMYILALNIPGPEGRILIGNLLDFKGSVYDIFDTFNINWTLYGKIYKIWILNSLWIFLADPADVKHLMSKLKVNNRPSVFRPLLSRFVGDGLITMDDDSSYKSHRKTVLPLFYPSLLKNLCPVFEEGLRAHAEMLMEVADGRTIDILDYISKFMIETLCSTIIGCDISLIPGLTEDLCEALSSTEELFMELMIKPWLRVPFIQSLFASGRKCVGVRKCLVDFLEQAILDKKQEFNEGRTKGSSKMAIRNEDGEMEEAIDFLNKKASSLLDMMIEELLDEDSDPSIEDIIREEILNIMIAGFTTTGSTLAFLFVLLGIHQEVQQEVSRELEEVFGSSPRAATPEDLARLDTLDRAIKETLRLFPTVPFIPREIYEDIHLPSGRVVPAGSYSVVLIYPLQRDPASFQDPDRFLPDRWLPQNQAHLNADAYAPFGAGTRTCIGFRYATLQLKVAASHLLRRFKITTAFTMKDLSRLSANLTLNSEKGYKVQLHKK